jgi:hypothetical protein
VAAADSDGDELADPFDNCAEVPNASQDDRDGDGVGDRCDLVDDTCRVKPEGTACNDGDACTASDRCRGGLCVGGTRLDCNDGQFCNGVETCAPARGCRPGVPSTADDGLACTRDHCDETARTIIHAPDPGRCHDGNACTDDACDPATGCIHTPVICGSGGPCSVCDPVRGCELALLEGFAGLECAFSALLDDEPCASQSIGAKVRGTIDRRVRKAQFLANQAAAADHSVRTHRRLLREAKKQLKRVRKAVRQAAERGWIGPACRDTLETLVAAPVRLLADLQAG